MRAFLVAIAAGIAAILTMPPYPRPVQASVSIHLDPGGSVADYLRWYRRLADAGVIARIDGSCVSACTLVLAMPRPVTCITEDARLGFHLASVDGKDDPEVTDELVKEFYPPRVQQWIKDHGPLVSAPIYMLGSEAIALGVMRECSP
jgi:hypothetical protein